MIQRLAFIAGALFVVLVGRETLFLIGGVVTAPAGNAAAERAPPERAAVAGNGRVVLRKAANGHFAAAASAEGKPLDFLVDTGATVVVLTSETAIRLGFRPRPADYTATMQTANGSIGAMPVVLKELRVSQIALRDVKAVITPPGALTVNLLGMSFLSRLRKFEFAGNEMILTP